MHALTRSGATAIGVRRSRSRSSSVASAQRGTNAHPGSGSLGLGTEPASAASRRSRAVSSVSRERSRPWVYGCAGAPSTSAVGPISAMRPAYSTAMRSEICAATPRSWVISTMLQPISSRSRCSRRKHLSLHGDVECGRRLVGDDELRVTRDGDRDHHALPQAAGEFVREGAHAPLRVGNADGGQQTQRLLVAARRLGDLPADPHGGVQRGHRVLEHRAEVEPPHLAQCLGLAVDHVRARHPDGAVDLGLLGQQTEQGESRARSCRNRIRRPVRGSPRARSPARHRAARARRGRCGGTSRADRRWSRRDSASAAPQHAPSGASTADTAMPIDALLGSRSCVQRHAAVPLACQLTVFTRLRARWVSLA